jgi:hypothetical protein
MADLCGRCGAERYLSPARRAWLSACRGMQMPPVPVEHETSAREPPDSRS